MSRRRREFRHPGRRPTPSRSLRACPGWCEVDHAIDVDTEGIRGHIRDVSRRVNIIAAENLETGEWTDPEVSVAAGDLTTAEQVRELVVELLDAADILEHGAR